MTQRILIEVTVVRHAELHRLLWEANGHEEDRLAWQGLAGIVGKEELIHKLSVLGASKGGIESNKRGSAKKANAKHIHLLNTDPEYRARWLKNNSKPKKNKENYKGPKSTEHAENIRKASLSRPRVPCKFCGNGYTKANIKKHEKSCA